MTTTHRHHQAGQEEVGRLREENERLREALCMSVVSLAGLMGEDEKIKVGIGGNPNYVEKVIIPNAHEAIKVSRKALNTDGEG